MNLLDSIFLQSILNIQEKRASIFDEGNTISFATKNVMHLYSLDRLKAKGYIRTRKYDRDRVYADINYKVIVTIHLVGATK